jgi:NAD(P)-dependent dehydrogenase (short-subunit alcohol dehydrogenase family)
MREVGRLTSRAVVVSGAASGIGAVAARMVVRECFVVVALDVTGTVEKITGEIRESGGKAYPLTGDVTDECTWHEAVAVAGQTCGGIDVLISNAYTLAVKPLHELELGVAPRARVDTMQLGPVLTPSWDRVSAQDREWNIRSTAAGRRPRIPDEGTL